MKDEFISHSGEETFALGKSYAKKLIPGDIVGLFGNLGTGKTQFVKGICDYFNVNDVVNSPTFTIVNEYTGNIDNRQISINHFDLFRLTDANELIQIGIENYISDNSICLIEWAELARKYFKENLKKVYLDYCNVKTDRKIKF